MVWAMVNHPKKVVLLWSAKSGCTVVKNLMFYYDTGIILLNQLKIHSVRGGYDEVSFKELDTEKYDDYRFLMVIRNPYERFCSGVYRMCEDMKKSFEEIFNDFFPNGYLTEHHLELQCIHIDGIKRNRQCEIFDVSELHKVNDILSSLYPEREKFEITFSNKGRNRDKYPYFIKKYKSEIEKYYKKDFDFIKNCGIDYGDCD